MLLPNFSVTQEQCDELIFRDTTPDYSPVNQNGYGGPNVDANMIVYATIKLNFGRGHSIELGTNYNRTKGDWLIVANDIPAPANPNNPDGNCNSCNPFEDDNDEIYKSGFLRTFPSGCITIIYEVFSSASGYPDNRKPEGVKITSIVLSCHEEEKFAEKSFKMALPGQEVAITNPIYESKAKDNMKKLWLAWTKLKLVDSGCDCECMANRIRQINNILDSL